MSPSGASFPGSVLWRLCRAVRGITAAPQPGISYDADLEESVEALFAVLLVIILVAIVRTLQELAATFKRKQAAERAALRKA